MCSPPEGFKIQTWSVRIMAHSRGGANVSGHYSYERAPGARWVAALVVAPAASATALATRAWLHGLRGRYGHTWLNLPSPDITRARTPTDYSDGFKYSDGTQYTDFGTANRALTASAAAGASTITVNSVANVYVGQYAVVGSNGQLVQVTEINGSVLTVRPRLRKAWPNGTRVSIGEVQWRFRLLSETVPAVPLIKARSAAFDIELEEAY